MTPSWATQLAVGASRDRSTNVVSDPPSFNNGEFNSGNLAVTWTNEIELARTVLAQVGAEYLRQAGESTSYDPSFSGQSQRFTRSVGSAWAGVTGDWGPHQFQLNVRQDSYSDVGGATTGLAAYGYKFAGPGARPRRCPMRFARRASTISTFRFSATRTSIPSARSVANSDCSTSGRRRRCAQRFTAPIRAT